MSDNEIYNAFRNMADEHLRGVNMGDLFRSYMRARDAEDWVRAATLTPVQIYNEELEQQVNTDAPHKIVDDPDGDALERLPL